MIGASKVGDFGATGCRPGQADGRHDRLCTRIAKGNALHARQLSHQFRHFACQRELGAKLDAQLMLFNQRLLKKGGSMTKEQHAKTHG